MSAAWPVRRPGRVDSVGDVRGRGGASAKAAGKTVEIVIYPDAGHGFHADYRPSYNCSRAEDGWRRMLAWFGRYGVAPQS